MQHRVRGGNRLTGPAGGIQWGRGRERGHDGRVSVLPGASPPTTAPRRELANLGPRAQLRAGRLGRRLPQLFVGLVLYGVSMGLVIRSDLGLFPWDVLHYGLARHLPLSFGEIVIVVSFLVLLLWWPLRQAPGFGTLANAVVIGLVTDRVLALVPPPDALWLRAVLLVGGIALNGLATALYVGSQLGPGPRDGLMTGLHRRTGLSLRLVRTGIEVSVVVLGWLLGGVFGIGTVLYALAIGPLVQLMLPACVVELPGVSAGVGAGVSAGSRSAPRRPGRPSPRRW